MESGKSTARLTVVSNRARPGQDAPFASYELARAFDEMFAPDGEPHGHAKNLYDTLCTLPVAELERRQQTCERSFLHQGITFTVYGNEEAT